MGACFEKSFFPNTLKLWNDLAKAIQSKNLQDFKTEVKIRINPFKYKHFSKGSKLGNSLLTRIRVGRSDLKEHKFLIGQSESTECLCHHNLESPKHFFLDCFLYSVERWILFDLIEHLVPNFPRLNRNEKFDIIIRGVDITNTEFLSTNTRITKAVQKFIISSKRFSVYEEQQLLVLFLCLSGQLFVSYLLCATISVFVFSSYVYLYIIL